MSTRPAFITEWPEGPLDPRFGDLVFNGGWAGVGAASVGFLVYFAAHLTLYVGSLTPVTVHGLHLAAIGVGLGPVFAWVTRWRALPLMPAGLLLGLLLVLVAREWTLASAIPVLLYGATLGLLLRHLRGGDEAGAS